MKATETDTTRYTYTSDEHVRAVENELKLRNLKDIAATIGFVAVNGIGIYLLDWIFR